MLPFLELVNLSFKYKEGKSEINNLKLKNNQSNKKEFEIFKNKKGKFEDNLQLKLDQLVTQMQENQN